MPAPTYLHLAPDAIPPDISALAPFRAVVILETEVTAEWQASVSDWLVRYGCLYMMAWGTGCGSWDDSVDMANIEQFDFEDIPDDKFVMTTWHDNEPLAQVFWFCKHCASHPEVELKHALLLHISEQEREQEIVRLYAEA